MDYGLEAYGSGKLLCVCTASITDLHPIYSRVFEFRVVSGNSRFPQLPSEIDR